MIQANLQFEQIGLAAEKAGHPEPPFCSIISGTITGDSKMSSNRDAKGVFVKGHKSNVGRHHSVESKKLMSDIAKKKGRIPPFEMLRGVPLTKEHKAKLSKNNGLHWLGKKLSKEHVLKISKSRRGCKSHLWKGGITPKNQIIRESAEYGFWRKAVFERDGYTCLCCGTKSGNGKAVKLEAHHIKSFSKYPDQRFNVGNGQTLCVDCHKKTKNYRGKSNEDEIALS